MQKEAVRRGFQGGQEAKARSDESLECAYFKCAFKSSLSWLDLIIYFIMASQEGFFLYLPSLKQWVKRGLDPVVKESIRDSGRGDMVPVQETGSTKAHFDTNQTKGNPDPATNGAPHLPIEEFGNPLLCTSMEKEKASQSNIPASPLNGLGLTKGSQSAASAMAKGLADGRPSTDYASSASSLEESDLNALACELNNEAITCPHGKLDPEETRNTRVVSAVCFESC
jgi:hypothetical protein